MIPSVKWTSLKNLLLGIVNLMKEITILIANQFTILLADNFQTFKCLGYVAL